ncbi:MAG: hypothetical protein FWG31_04155 [Oscillospiraceae bacterium]|nr:hypothetical protein [Oscillospiraceae bacterium]
MKKLTKPFAMNRLKMLALSLLLLFATSILSPIALAAWTPNRDGQNKTNWCWAAASKMVGVHNGGAGALNTGETVLANTSGLHTFNGNPYYGQNASYQYTADAGQRQLLMHVKGHDQNVIGYNHDREDAMLKASNLSVRVGSYGSDYGLSSPNVDSLKMDMASSKWVVGTMFKENTDTGHCIVIQSYSTSANEYIYWDPWNNAQYWFPASGLTDYDIRTAYSSDKYRMHWINWCRY